jgi:hypothetical protein
MVTIQGHLTIRPVRASALGVIKTMLFALKQPLINRAGGGRSYITSNTLNNYT